MESPRTVWQPNGFSLDSVFLDGFFLLDPACNGRWLNVQRPRTVWQPNGFLLNSVVFDYFVCMTLVW